MQRILLSCAVLLLAVFNSHAQSPIQLAECRLESTNSRGAISAQCGWFEVAEDRETPNSKHIRVHVAVVRALRKRPLPDAVFLVSGGPGQAASDFYLSSYQTFEMLRRDRDIVVVDQRGTGMSQRLDCNLPDDLDAARFDRELLQRSTRECLNKLPGDPRFYSTSVAVRDLEEIRAALGYAQINLYGISYGTRVVQHYLRHYPKQVRAAVLDGVVPVETILGPEIGPAAQRSFDAILARCANEAACHKAFPNITDEFRALLAQPTRGPMTITIADPRTAIPSTMKFTEAHLSVAVRILSYSDITASLLPFLIHEAAHNRPQALAAQALMVAQSIGDQVANGMHNAVVCTEDVPFFNSAMLDNPAIKDSYLGRVMTDSLQASCAVWPQGVLDADFHAPLSSNVPTLLLSGENDPVTPASFGEQALKAYSRGKHLVFAGQGHGQLNSACGARLIRAFIETLSVASLEDCVPRVLPMPFMLNANGPAP
jgi:pimeloyl-ACP methyl ester carboxylesterase